ncbi:MAG: hypothetical protein ACLTY5_00805 [Angelakisella sp.]
MAFEAAGNQGFVWGWKAGNKALVSSADRAYMKAPVPRPYGHRDQMWPHSGKVAGQRETVKAEMNGLTPGLDRSPPSRWVGGQGGQSLKVLLAALHSFLEAVFSQN